MSSEMVAGSTSVRSATSFDLTRSEASKDTSPDHAMIFTSISDGTTKKKSEKRAVNDSSREPARGQKPSRKTWERSMTRIEDVEEISVEDSTDSDSQTIDAECLNCGVKSRFCVVKPYAVGEEFHHNCVGCGDGPRPGLANRQRFRVTTVEPETAYAQPSHGVPVFQGNDSE